MSMRGSPVNWWREKRQSSHSSLPPAARPATAFPWNDGREIDPKKLIEEAVIAAFESDAFKAAVASQVDPAFTRNQEKLNQLKVTSLNLESALQSQFDDLNSIVKPVQEHLAALEIPDHGPELKEINTRLETLQTRLDEIDIPDHSKDLAGISSGQAKLLKLIESRFNAFESRIDELDRKIDGLDESVVNSDLRSALRFGELSNELQDRNVTLGDRIWEVEREMGRKMDTQQRKVVVTCEELGKNVRNINESLESMQLKMDSDDVLVAVGKIPSKVEMSEKALRRDLVEIQEKVASIDTSAIPSQSRKLEAIERGISDVKKEIEVQGNLASLDSKLLSTNTARLDNIVSVQGQIRTLTENTEKISQEVSRAQESDAATTKSDIEQVQLQLRGLDVLASSQMERLEHGMTNMTRMEEFMVGLDASIIGKLGAVESRIASIDEDVLTRHGSSLEELKSTLISVSDELKPHATCLNNMDTKIAQLKSSSEAARSEQTASLHSLQERVSDTSATDLLNINMSKLRSHVEDRVTNSLKVVQSDVATLLSNVTEMQSHVDEKLNSSLEKIRGDASNVLKMVGEAKNQAITHNDHIETSVKSIIESGTLSRETAYSQQQEILIAIAEASLQAPKKDDIVTMHGVLLDAAQKNEALLKESVKSKDIVELSAKLEHTTTSLSSDISIAAQKNEALLQESSKSKDIEDLSTKLDHMTTSLSSDIANASQKIEALSKESPKSKDIEDLSAKLEDITASLASDILTAAHESHALLEATSKAKDIEELSIRIDDLSTSLGSSIESMSGGIQATSRSAVDSITKHITELDQRTQASFEIAASTAVEQTTSLHGPIKEIFGELRRNQASMKMEKEDVFAELQSTKAAIQTSKEDHLKANTAVIELLQEAHKSSKDTEILEQIEHWSERHALQKEDTASILQLLQAGIERDDTMQGSLDSVGEKASRMFDCLRFGDFNSSSTLRELAAIKTIVQNDDALSSIKQTVTDTHATLVNVQNGIQHIKEDGTIRSIKQLLLQNASSMATAYEGILAIDTKMIASEETLHSTIQDTNASLSKDILDAISSITTSVADDVADMKTNLSSRISTSTNVLRAEIKGIDVSPATTAVEALREETKTQSEATNAKTKTLVEELQSSVDFSVNSLAQLVRHFTNGHTKSSEQTATALSQLEQLSITLSTSVSDILTTVQQDLRPIGDDVKSVIGSLHTIDHTTRSSVTELSTINNLITSKSADTQKQAIEAQASVLSVIQGNASGLHQIEELLQTAFESTKEALKVIDAGITNSRKSAIQDTADLKATVSHDIGASKAAIMSNVDTMRGKVEELAAETDRAHEATLATIKSESKSIAEALLRESRNTNESVDGVKQSVVSELQTATTTTASNLSVIQATLQESVDDIASNINKGFAHSSTEIRDARKASETNFAALSEAIRSESQNTQTILESSQNRVISEVQKTSLPLRSSLNSLKSDISSVSSDLHISESAIRNDIKSLDSKTVSRITGVETSIENTKDSLNAGFAGITNGVKAIDAAVRVNSAAIARVDKAVLETGSQVKSCVLDGNREVLFQLDEELHESGTRVRGISEFDIPRLEALGKRNTDALEVIGARVIGTTKKFDELVTQHGAKHKSMEVSEILNGRLRGNSNTSSRDSGGLRMSAA